MKLTHHLLTLSNLLSFARILLVWPIIVFLYQQTDQGNFYAFLLMIVVVITDYLDGYFARHFNQKSDFGRIIDPVADKIAAGAVAIVLTQTHGLPVWYLILIIVRDLAILLFGLRVVKNQKEIPESNWPGKLAVTTIAIVILAYTLDLAVIREIALYVSVAFLIYSVISYLNRYQVFAISRKSAST